MSMTNAQLTEKKRELETTVTKLETKNRELRYDVERQERKTQEQVDKVWAAEKRIGQLEGQLEAVRRAATTAVPE